MPFLGSPFDQDAILHALATAEPRSFHPVGNTNIVYEVDLEGPVDAAFKPRSRVRARGYRAEIAAYRIARLLRMDDVPPVALRRLSRATLFHRLDPSFADAKDEIDNWTHWDADGTVPTAVIYWIPQMRNLKLERGAAMQQWTGWLTQGHAIPADDRALAADLSKMVAFDFLIGNWDRFSGGNCDGLPDGSRLFIRDHDVAFASPLPTPIDNRLLAHVRRAEKLSADFVRALNALTEARLRADLAAAGSTARTPLLDDDQIRDVMARRATLRSYIGALLAAYGSDRVLVFP